MKPTLVLAGLAVNGALAASIDATYQSLLWKHDEGNFWAPLGLDATAYELESPAGAAPEALSKRCAGGCPSQFLPCTVVTVEGELSGSSLEARLEAYRAVEDDVWSEAQFGECLLIQAAEASASVDVDSLSDFFLNSSTTDLFISSAYNISGLVTSTSLYSVAASSNHANGPCVVSVSPGSGGISITPAYALHEDVYEAFMSGAIVNPVAPDSHLTLHVSIPGTRLPAIVVPSRIPSAITASEEAGPLAGLRFAVKDIFHIKGLKTSGGSRAYYQVYGPQNYTTDTVEKSLLGGAQMVGKTKTIAFALGAPQNGAEIDYLDPWNSRGDGYQTTGGSSSGSGSAATAYDWLDFTIGSDTGGSVRFPARFGGLYGYKPTHGIFNLTGILVAIAEQDTPGFLTRSPSIFTTLGKWWAKDTPLDAAANTPMPTNLLYYEDEILTQPEAEAMKTSFFANVTAALNLTTSSINFTSTWLETGPSDGEGLDTYMAYVYSDQNSVQFYEEIGLELDALYRAANNGSHFPADPMVNVTWHDAQNSTTRARLPSSIAKREAFAAWFHGNVLPPSDETCSESIFAHSLHIAPGMEKVAHVEPSVADYYWDGVFVNYAGIPEIVVPIGQIRYASPYTLREEWQPVTVAFAAAKGCDLKLFELVERLEEAGLVRETLAGKVAYYTDEVW